MNSELDALLFVYRIGVASLSPLIDDRSRPLAMKIIREAAAMRALVDANVQRIAELENRQGRQS